MQIKNKLKLFIVAIFVLCLGFAPIANFSAGVYADTPTETEFGAEVPLGNYGISDGSLYAALLAEFNNTYAADPNFVPFSSLYEDMFDTFTELDLSNKMIYNLDGLGLLNFSSLQQLNLAQNRISVWNTLSYFPALETLNLFDNNLQELDVSNLQELATLNANYNNLTSLDVSQMQTGVIYASNNAFDNVSDLVFGQNVQTLKIYLFNNNITNASQVQGVQFVFGLQGVANLQKPQNTTTIMQVQTQYMPTFGAILDYDVVLQIVNTATNEVVQTLSDTDQVLELPFGTYQAVYVDATLLTPVFVATDPEWVAFEDSLQFQIVPSEIQTQFVIDDITYDYYSGTLPSNTQLVLTSFDEDAVIYYKLPNDETWTQGNTVVLPDLGRYAVQVKTVVAGVESTPVAIYVNTQTQSNISVWLLTLVMLGLLTTSVVAFLVYNKYYAKK